MMFKENFLLSTRGVLNFLLAFIFPETSAGNILDKMNPDFLQKISRETPPIKEDWVSAILPYKEKIVRKFIWLLKYKVNSLAIERAANIILENQKELWAEKIFFSGGRRVVLVTVPTSKKRSSKFGVGHMDLIIEKILDVGGNEYAEFARGVLMRKKEILPQTSIKNREERLKNQKDSMKINDNSKIILKTVFVIDDVITTGATISEARRVLLEAGAKEVYCLAIAH